jgi:hypothetical protein
VLGTVACGDAPKGNVAAEPLVLLDSIVLQEPDSALIGEPSGIAGVAEGLLVSDRSAGVVRVHDHSGALIRQYGRRGTGPGEWARGPRLFFVQGDTIAFASDGGQTRWFAVPGGTSLGAHANPGFLALTASGKGIVYGVMDREKGTSLREVAFDGTALRQGGHVPAAAARSALVAQMVSMPAAVLLPGDSVAMAFQGSDHLYYGPFAGGRYDSVLVPVRQRRGARQDLLARVNDEDPGTMGPALYQPSYPGAIASIAGGAAIAVVYLDMTFVENRRMTGRPWLSIVGRSNGSVCSDIAIGGATDPLPNVAFRADTLLVLTQEVRDTSSATIVRRYRVSPSGCVQEPRS